MFQGPEGFHEGTFEVVADSHDFPGCLHLGAQLAGSVVEFVKRPLRNLADDVVKGWFVRSVGLARYGVDDFIQVVAQSNLGSKLGDRVASCF